MFNPFDFFKKRSKSSLGVDIGTSSIKVVQLNKEEDKFELETYGELSAKGYIEKLNDSFQTTSLKRMEAVTRELLSILLEKAEVTTRETVMSIPVFSSFVSVIEMPQMAEKELEQAVEFEAKRYIPIPASEVVLDWKIIDSGMIKNGSSKQAFKGRRIILIAVPKEVINKYISMSEDLGLNINALELESFSLARSLIKDINHSACILDVGARATSFTIVDKGMVQMSHSLDIAGAEMTKRLSIGLNVSSGRAEDFKVEHGLNHAENSEGRENIHELLKVPVDKIIDEINRMIKNYKGKTGREIKELILNGGSARLVGLDEYIEDKINIKTVVANPWEGLVYPPSLQKYLKEIAPEFSVAVGAAMRKN
ncbi:MAG: type IV pilus assembly protein PilM [Candidatus Portnoybacteria bacterium]|nr:type IV pilus assembly protein PilM [Candidatus Portnoybacteria bacterium]